LKLGHDLHTKWFTGLYEQSSIPERYLVKARALEKLLIATAPQPLVLCHGDLHHGNILKNKERWMAIDPFPAFAERAFEASHFLWNPYRFLAGIPDSDLYALLQRRIVFMIHEL
jgi:streptomycin 6-kinase